MRKLPARSPRRARAPVANPSRFRTKNVRTHKRLIVKESKRAGEVEEGSNWLYEASNIDYRKMCQVML